MQVRLCLSLLAFAILLGGCKKTEENLAKQDQQRNAVEVEVALKNVRIALENYRVEQGEYPESLEILVKGGRLDKTGVVDPWGTPLVYQRPEPGKYVLKSLGPDKQEGTDDISLKQL
jgi:type II secretory pathway pseudopilin PulG